MTTATIETTHGNIVIELDTENTPVTAQNFMDYANDGFYVDTVFHRVIDNFMIQGGGLTEDMQTKDTKGQIENEANKGGKNVLGSVAMARTMDPHSATAQFFINVKDNDFLNFKSESMDGWGYCVFGKVIEGMDVVEAIKGVKTGNRGGHGDVPVEAITIKNVTIAE